MLVWVLLIVLGAFVLSPSVVRWCWLTCVARWSKDAGRRVRAVRLLELGRRSRRR